MEIANVVCMKWGTLYGPEYVNNLYTMVSRHLSRPFRFVCFTDAAAGIDERVEIHPFPPFHAPEAYAYTAYRKKTLCRADLTPFREGERFLYLDLDVLIMDDIDCFFDYEPAKDFIIAYNWTRGEGRIGNSSVTMFRMGPLQYVIDDLEADFLRYRQKFGTASQEYMSSKIIERYGKLCFWPDAWVKSFQVHCLPGRLLRGFKTPVEPDECRILVFHGDVNPPDAIRGYWPRDRKRIPFHKRWYKTLRPTPWIARYWPE